MPENEVETPQGAAEETAEAEEPKASKETAQKPKATKAASSKAAAEKKGAPLFRHCCFIPYYCCDHSDYVLRKR